MQQGEAKDYSPPELKRIPVLGRWLCHKPDSTCQTFPGVDDCVGIQ